MQDIGRAGHSGGRRAPSPLSYVGRDSPSPPLTFHNQVMVDPFESPLPSGLDSPSPPLTFHNQVMVDPFESPLPSGVDSLRYSAPLGIGGLWFDSEADSNTQLEAYGIRHFLQTSFHTEPTPLSPTPMSADLYTHSAYLFPPPPRSRIESSLVGSGSLAEAQLYGRRPQLDSSSFDNPQPAERALPSVASPADRQVQQHITRSSHIWPFTSPQPEDRAPVSATSPSDLSLWQAFHRTSHTGQAANAASPEESLAQATQHQLTPQRDRLRSYHDPLDHPGPATAAQLMSKPAFIAALQPVDMEPDDMCPICYNAYEDAVKLSCGHTYCDGCIKTWCMDKDTCPMDRSVLFQETLSPPRYASMRRSHELRSAARRDARRYASPSTRVSNAQSAHRASRRATRYASDHRTGSPIRIEVTDISVTMDEDREDMAYTDLVLGPDLTSDELSRAPLVEAVQPDMLSHQREAREVSVNLWRQVLEPDTFHH